MQIPTPSSPPIGRGRQSERPEHPGHRGGRGRNPLYDKDQSRAPLPGAGPTTSTTPHERDSLDRGGFRQLLSAAGVRPDTTVIVYGGNNNWFATYAYWLLKSAGSTT